MRPRPINAAPNAVPWPPLIYGAATLAGVALGRRAPVTGWLPSASRPLGAAVMLAGLALGGSAVLSMQRQRANMLPHRPATTLVTSWPFSMSRNPMYLGDTLMLAGAAPAFGNPWFAPLAALATFAVTNLAIKREERHLAALFGAAWQRYADRVPRWLRLPP